MIKKKHAQSIRAALATFIGISIKNWEFPSVADPGWFIPDQDPTLAPSRIWIPDPGGKKAPDSGSQILLYIKIGMKNKTNFFLAFYSFRNKFY
jgi:hypothetical protein